MFYQLLEPIRYFWKALTAERLPRDIALGVALGLMVGLIPKGNLTAVALAIMMAALRLNLGAGLLSAFCVSTLSPNIDAFTHGIGLRILDLEIAERLLTRWYDLPFVPWLSLNNTVVLGNLVLGLILFYPSYHITNRMAKHVSPLIARWRGKAASETPDAATNGESLPSADSPTLPTRDRLGVANAATDALHDDSAALVAAAAADRLATYSPEITPEISSDAAGSDVFEGAGHSQPSSRTESPIAEDPGTTRPPRSVFARRSVKSSPQASVVLDSSATDSTADLLTSRDSVPAERTIPAAQNQAWGIHASNLSSPDGNLAYTPQTPGKLAVSLGSELFDELSEGTAGKAAKSVDSAKFARAPRREVMSLEELMAAIDASDELQLPQRLPLSVEAATDVAPLQSAPEAIARRIVDEPLGAGRDGDGNGDHDIDAELRDELREEIRAELQAGLPVRRPHDPAPLFVRRTA